MPFWEVLVSGNVVTDFTKMVLTVYHVRKLLGTCALVVMGLTSVLSALQYISLTIKIRPALPATQFMDQAVKNVLAEENA